MGSVEHLQRAHPPNPSISLYRNVVSYADGPRGNSTGRLLFYLTTLDATAYDAQANASAMLTVSEAQLPGSCRGLDAEDPPCAKISILGELHRVPASEEGAARVRFLRSRASCCDQCLILLLGVRE